MILSLVRILLKIFQFFVASSLDGTPVFWKACFFEKIVVGCADRFCFKNKESLMKIYSFCILKTTMNLLLPCQLLMKAELKGSEIEIETWMPWPWFALLSSSR